MTSLTEEHLQGILIAYYTEKYTASRAHSKLLEITKKEIFTVDQVKDFYEKMRSGELPVGNEKLPEDPKLHFSYIMATCHKHVLKHCDLTDRLTLRKVSHQCRNLIDTSKFPITKLTITEIGHRIRISADTTIIQYEEVGTGHVVIHGDKMSLRKNEPDIENAAVQDLKICLAFSKLEIEVLNFFAPRYTGRSTMSQVFCEAATIPLKIRKVSGLPPDLLMNVLPKIDETYIKVIKIVSRVTRLEDASEISKLVQWKNANELITNQRFSGDEIAERLGNFDYVDFVVGSDKPVVVRNDLVKLKGAFLLRPTLQKFEIIPTYRHKPYDSLFWKPPEEFLPFRNPRDPQLFEFKYPSNEVLSVRINTNQVLFKGPCYAGDKIVIDIRRGYQPPEGQIVEDDHVDDD